jgi:hypothetical protein
MRKEIESQKGVIGSLKSTSQAEVDEKQKTMHEFLQQRVSTLELDKITLAKKAEKLEKQNKKLKFDGIF